MIIHGKGLRISRTKLSFNYRKTMKTFVIGDIHGGLKALIQVLEKANPKKKDRLIFLGDFVDGWSESMEVIDYLIKLNHKFSCIFLRGNHDDLVFQWLKGDQLNDNWLQHGGKSTQKSYLGITQEKLQGHLSFYENLLDYHINDRNQLFLHAGFTNIHGPAREYSTTAFYWDRTLWEAALALDPNLKTDDIRYPKRFKHFPEIFIGHTPVTQIGKTKPVKAATIWNMDTGAAFKGPLSMMEVNSKELIQSEPVYKLYPKESGRN